MYYLDDNNERFDATLENIGVAVNDSILDVICNCGELGRYGIYFYVYGDNGKQADYQFTIEIEENRITVLDVELKTEPIDGLFTEEEYKSAIIDFVDKEFNSKMKG